MKDMLVYFETAEDGSKKLIKQEYSEKNWKKASDAGCFLYFDSSGREWPKVWLTGAKPGWSINISGSKDGRARQWPNMKPPFLSIVDCHGQIAHDSEYTLSNEDTIKELFKIVTQFHCWDDYEYRCLNERNSKLIQHHDDAHHPDVY